MKLPLLGFLSCLVLLPGCGNARKVTVMDADTGRPVSGARVTPAFPSYNGQPSATAADGVARIPANSKIIGIMVDAPGYENAWEKDPAAGKVLLKPKPAVR